MSSGADDGVKDAATSEETRVRRMRAQLLTVVGCVVGMTVTFFVASAVL